MIYPPHEARGMGTGLSTDGRHVATAAEAKNSFDFGAGS